MGSVGLVVCEGSVGAGVLPVVVGSLLFGLVVGAEISQATKLNTIISASRIAIHFFMYISLLVGSSLAHNGIMDGVFVFHVTPAAVRRVSAAEVAILMRKMLT